MQMRFAIWGLQIRSFGLFRSGRFELSTCLEKKTRLWLMRADWVFILHLSILVSFPAFIQHLLILFYLFTLCGIFCFTAATIMSFSPLLDEVPLRSDQATALSLIHLGFMPHCFTSSISFSPYRRGARDV